MEQQNETKTTLLSDKQFITKDSGVRETFGSGMVRDTQNDKPRYDLCWKPLYKRWAELMGRGAVKYGENNWKKATGEAELARFKASAERHMMQWLEGDQTEDHAAAVLFNLAGAEYVLIQLRAEWGLIESCHYEEEEIVGTGVPAMDEAAE